MKKFAALILALGSGLYLLVMGPMIDPIPFVDEATAFVIFVNSLAYLGLDLRRLVGMKPKARRKSEGRTVDI